MFYKDNPKIAEENEPMEVIFEKDFSFKVISKDGTVLNPKGNGKYVYSIYDLPIEGVYKRFREENEIPHD